MRKMIAAFGASCALGVVVSPASAQQPTPTHSVVRFFKCNPQGVGVQWFQRLRPIARQMIAEGKFIDYGILAHAWGDEWNVVDYFVISGLDDFFANFTELTRRAQAASQQAQGQEQLRPLGEVCTEHKDVIYAVVAPSGGG